MLTLSALDVLYGVAATGTAVTYSIYGRLVIGGFEDRRRLAQGQLATLAGSIYSVADSTAAVIETIILTNTTGSDVSGVILYDGGTAASNQLTGSLTIPANGTCTLNAQGLRVNDASGNLYASGSNFYDAVAPAVTTPLALGTTGAATPGSRRDHTHQSPGGIASLTAATSAIAATEAQVIGATIPANLAKLGTTFRIKAWGTGTTSTGPGNGTFRVRIGTTTLTGNIASSVASPFVASVTAQTFSVEATVTVTTAGSSGKICGSIAAYGSGDLVAGLMSQAVTVGVVSVASAVALDTTAQKILELTFQSGDAAASCTFTGAEISVVKM